MEIVEFLKEKRRMCNSYINCSGCPLYISNNKFELICRHFEIQRPKEYVEIIEKWSEENPKPILTDEERNYLYAVITPFGDRIKIIKKCIDSTKGYAYISIEVESIENSSNCGFESIELPYFKEDKMYKNMENFKSYTLEELGLQESQTEQADNQEHCVCCGEPIPEGQQVCYKCKKEAEQ